MVLGSAIRAAVALVICMPAVVLSTAVSGKEKAKSPIFAELVTPSMLAQATGAPRRKPVDRPVFFSINSVLAKIDGKQPIDTTVRVASVASNVALSDSLAETVVDASPANRVPFGLLSFKAPEGPLWKKWQAIRVDIDSDLAALALCTKDETTCDQGTTRFRTIIAETRRQSGHARIETANRLINGAIRYTSDLVQHGVLDHWSAPIDSLSSGRGDCEDYAIAKYVVLREAGVAEADLRILLGRDSAARQDHAVLAVRDQGTWIILDNRSNNTKSDDDTTNFRPLFALDRGGVSLFASPYLSANERPPLDSLPAASAPDPSEDLGAWNEPNGDDGAASSTGLRLGAAGPGVPYLL